MQNNSTIKIKLFGTLCSLTSNQSGQGDSVGIE